MLKNKQPIMDKDKYIKERIDDQITWYNKKSKTNKFMFRLFSLLLIIAATSIPFITGYITDTTPALKFIVGLLGVFVAVISGIISLNKFQENWIQYRTTCETLKHHKFLFLAAAKPYHEENAFQQFVENVESLISKENSQWGEYIVKKNDGKKNT